jgi:hypothetical protein
MFTIVYSDYKSENINKYFVLAVEKGDDHSHRHRH